jgi:hypothetical protein
MRTHIVILGNPVDGLSFVGPFDEAEDAVDWATGPGQKEDWFVAPMDSPDEAPDDHWHINVYERGREYGGPEEGGWWYDTGRYCPEKSITLSRAEYHQDMARLFADDLADRLGVEANDAGVPPVGSTTYRGGRYLVLVEPGVGADFPAERPVYS